MKRIAVFTIQSENYGNRLQNYAVNKVLEKMNYKVENLQTQSIKDIARDVIERHPHASKHKLALLVYAMMKRRIEAITNSKKRKFYLFNKKMRYSSNVISPNCISRNLNRKYDAFVVGSDQVWNTTFSKIVSINSFLPFEHSDKIAFSASFGLDEIPYNQEIISCLNSFKALSVREEAGANIIKKLTGREATVLVDPTMLLTAEEWRKISKKPKKGKEGYALTYFLSPKSEEAKKQLEEIKNNREVYELLDLEDKVIGDAGPAEFIWLFDHADIILTDSFHACVFSFLFDKPFVLYDRNWNNGNMNSRLMTLLKKFHLERKYANSDVKNSLWEHDYKEGYNQLELEKKKAYTFLKNALGE